MRPQRLSTIPGSASRVVRTVERRLRARVSTQSWSVAESKSRPPTVPPTLLTRMSTGPRRRTASS